jgi:SAM-dependent methyltransferase
MTAISHQPWARFFGSRPYPLDLGIVEARDDTAKQVSFLRRFLAQTGTPILDLGCGWGRHAGPLACDGRRVVALDYGHYNCVRTKQRNQAIEVVSGDMRQLPFLEGSFAAIYSMYTCIGYEPGSDQEVFSEVARVLRHDGIFCLDLINGHHLMRLPRLSAERVPDGFAVIVTFRIHDRQVSRHFVVFTPRGLRMYNLRIRGYSAAELSTMCKQAGLRIQFVYGDYDLRPYRWDSPRYILICSKHCNRRS